MPVPPTAASSNHYQSYRIWKYPNLDNDILAAMRMSERSKIAELFRLADDLESVEKDGRKLSHIERCI